MEYSLQSYTATVFAKNGIPLKLLRIAPLIFTTVLFINRVAQYFAITTFMPPYMPQVPESSSASRRLNPAPVLRVWLRTSIERFFPGVLAVVMLLRLTLLANILVRPDDLVFSGAGYARALYGIGFLLSFAHLLLAPGMLKIENAMKSPQTRDDEIVPLLRRWFGVNNVRMWTMDFPLWLVSVAAVTQAMKL